MPFNFDGVCKECGAEVSITVHNGKLLNGCTECNQAPFEFSQFKGVVYVISNPLQKEVKIGMTTKSVEERAKQLAKTGVPGKFEIIAIFPSNKPDKDENSLCSWTATSS